MIGIVTGFVGDLANLVGCCLGIPAAQMDPYADASIGNITGSNSVNVFIGLGLSWSIAAFYWQFREPTQEWIDRVTLPGGVYYNVRDDIAKAVDGSGKAVFVVPAGTLWFNLMVFSCNAFFAIQHLAYR